MVHEFYYLADVSWFDRNGKPVDAAAVREQLAKWTPVLVLPGGKNRVSVAGSVCEDCCWSAIGRMCSSRCSPRRRHGCDGVFAGERAGAASPVPTRARMDEKGRVILRPMLKFKPVYETRVKTITFNTETGPKYQGSMLQVMPMVMELKCEELAVEPKYVQFFDTEGKPVDAAAAAPQLAKETTVLVSGDGEEGQPVLLEGGAQPGTLVCVLPFDVLATGDVNSPVKATVEPRRCESPKPCHATAPAPVKAPEIAAPLPSPDAAALPAIDEKKAKEHQEASGQASGRAGGPNEFNWHEVGVDPAGRVHDGLFEGTDRGGRAAARRRRLLRTPCAGRGAATSRADHQALSAWAFTR